MPLCKHCQNLGLESANTHWLREGRGNNSRIICPQLLNTVCRFCKESGHTISYCPQLKKKDAERISSAKIQYISADTSQLNNVFDSNLFDSTLLDSTLFESNLFNYSNETMEIDTY